MTGARDLTGQPIAEPRKRGRPKGSTNRRAKDLTGFIGARYGATAAQQAAALCMVTPAELKTAGGSMAQALVNKAGDLVRRVREAQDQRDEALRRQVREIIGDMLEELGAGVELKTAMRDATKRLKEGTAGFGLRDALDLMAKERAQLLPYTDQRQPQRIEAKGEGLAPSVVLIDAGGQGGFAVMPSSVENTEVFEAAYEVVSPGKSHDQGQGAEIPGLLPPAATD